MNRQLSTSRAQLAIELTNDDSNADRPILFGVRTLE